MDDSPKKTWQAACEALLKAHSTEDAIRFWRVTHASPQGVCPIFDYRFEHTLAAVRLGRWLCGRTGADPEVVECALWLHDSKKYLNDPEGKDHHAQDAAEAVDAALEGTDFPVHKIPAVRHAVLHHAGLRLATPLEPLATACVWDADKLSKLGAASLVHFGCISGGFGPIDTLSILQRGERWLVLAKGVAESMNTLPAKEEANKRLHLITQYYEQLRREWTDPMQEMP